MRTFATLVLVALGLSAQAQDVFPLGDADVWEYGYVIDPPDAEPDTIRYEVRVTDRVVIADTAYAVVRFPAVPSDTLRVDAEGRLWGRVTGQDRLILDTTLPDGAVYRFDRDGRPDFVYEVTVVRPLTRDYPAGHFEGAIEFSFDVPDWHDDEFSVVVAPGVGVIAGWALYSESGELYSATVGGRRYTDAEGRPPTPEASAFPNPFVSEVTVTLPPGRWRTAEVVDLLGRRVALLTMDASGRAVRWDGSEHPPGVYVVRVQGPAGAVALRVARVR